MFQTGFFPLFRIAGIPIRAHWTVPVGLLMFSGGRFEPGLWIGILGLILLHEVGHAVVVHRVGLVNAGIDLTGFGGVCRWVGQPTRVQRGLVAWGGVAAQFLLLLVAVPLRYLLPPPSSAFVADLLYAATHTNLLLIALNLIPFGGLDGQEAWPLLRELYGDFRRRRRWKRKFGADPDPNRHQTLREALDEAEGRKRRR